MARQTKLNKFNWRELGLEYASPAYHRLWRQVNNEHSRAYHREYDKRMYKEKLEREVARRRRYIEKHPLKIKAHKIVKYAVAKGKIQKQPCHCSETNVVAHHPDYNKPLDVMWLCELHHKQWHRENKAIQHVQA